MNLRTFKTFPNKELAQSFAAVLSNKGIGYTIEEDALVFDASYAFNPMNRDYFLRIRQEDFAAATRAFNEFFSPSLDEVDPDYYLLEYSEEELVNIVARPHEWGSYDYELALKLLAQKGITFTEEEKVALVNEQVRKLAKPEGESVANIVAWYILSFFIFPIGLIIGWSWAYGTKVLPDGHRVQTYNKNVRRHGRIILTITLALIFLGILGTILRSSR